MPEEQPEPKPEQKPEPDPAPEPEPDPILPLIPWPPGTIAPTWPSYRLNRVPDSRWVPA